MGWVAGVEVVCYGGGVGEEGEGGVVWVDLMSKVSLDSGVPIEHNETISLAHALARTIREVETHENR